MPEDLDNIWEQDDPIEPFDRENKPKEEKVVKSDNPQITPAKIRQLPKEDSKWDKYKL